MSRPESPMVELGSPSGFDSAANLTGGHGGVPPGKVSSFIDDDPWYKRGWAKAMFVVLALLAVAAIAIGIAVPLSNKSKDEGSKDDLSRTTASDGGTLRPTSLLVGGDGSTVTMEDGKTFVYKNSFGGTWNAEPFNDTARAQAHVPPLSQPWDYQNDLILGVNLGGWLTIEPFISPALFEPFNKPGATEPPTVIDEWTLSEALGDKLRETIEGHYKTFITEADFAEIAGAGLSWIRLPIPFWVVESHADEPFLANVGWEYFVKALGWARKYGLRVNLDLHTIPGSQNGYNHSGKQGSINFLNGAMGMVNAQRTLSIIRTLTQFISRPEYKNVVPMFSVMNEPYATTIGMDTLRSFYYKVYEMVRSIGGSGEGNGPFIVFHDGFSAQNRNVREGGWNDYLVGKDRVGLDIHPYLCFAEPNNDGLSYQATKPCVYWANNLNNTRSAFGLVMGGEWSLAFNDCGKWINNIGNGQRFEGTYVIPGSGTEPQFKAVGSCDTWNNWPAYTDATKAGLSTVARAHMDAFRNWFFWTWKTGVSTETGIEANPFWNYQLGLREGWIPADPRTALGTCEAVTQSEGVRFRPQPAGPISDQDVGKVVGEIKAEDRAAYAWPPSQIGGKTPVANLATYTNTGKPITMTGAAAPAMQTGTITAAPTPTPVVGWTKEDDGEGGAYVPVEGCSYPDAWNAAGLPVPTAPACGAPALRRRLRKR